MQQSANLGCEFCRIIWEGFVADAKLWGRPIVASEDRSFVRIKAYRHPTNEDAKMRESLGFGGGAPEYFTIAFRPDEYDEDLVEDFANWTEDTMPFETLMLELFTEIGSY